MNDALYTKTLKYIMGSKTLAEGRDIPEFFSDLNRFLIKNRIDPEKFFLETINNLEDDFRILRSEIISQIEKNPNLRPVHYAAIESMNINKVNSPNQQFSNIIQTLARFGIKNNYNPAMLPVLLPVINKIKQLNQGLYNIQLIRLRERMERLFLMSMKYWPMEIKALKEIIIEGNKIYEEVVTNAIYPEKVRESSGSFLNKLGYLDVQLETEKMEDLARLVYDEKRSASITDDVRTSNPNIVPEQSRNAFYLKYLEILSKQEYICQKEHR